MNRVVEDGDMNCCSDEATTECCSNKAAETLVALNKKYSPSDPDKTSAVVATNKEEDASNAVICPKRRKRTVSTDFSTPCDCCPTAEERPSKKTKKKHSFVEDLAALADFLKKEREILMSSSKEAKMAEFYQPSQNDTMLVAEWRNSGNEVYDSMREKLRRLEDMEAKFGSWEAHFGTEGN